MRGFLETTKNVTGSAQKMAKKKFLTIFVQWLIKNLCKQFRTQKNRFQKSFLLSELQELEVQAKSGQTAIFGIAFTMFMTCCW